MMEPSLFTAQVLTHRTFIGVDPGPTTGFAVLWVHETTILRTHVLQCDDGIADVVLSGLIDASGSEVWVAVEKFVTSRRSLRLRGEAARTRSITADLAALARQRAQVVVRAAAEVKPWATNERLDRAGFLAISSGMTHARDAARHALFAAVAGDWLTDPLIAVSRRGGVVPTP